MNEVSSIIILRTRNIDRGKIIHTKAEINRCCKATGWAHDVHQLLNISVVDGIQRIPCNISREQFNQDYILKGNPVVLTNCTDDWKARNWTFEGTVIITGLT